MIKDSKILGASWWLENKIAILYVLVILFFYGFIATVIVNIPFYDDHNVFFKFLTAFEKRGWESVFTQHNEHRIVWFKLLVLLDQYVSTSVNITHYIWIGVLCLLGITKILYSSFNINENKLLHFLPVLLLIFMPVNKMHNWGMATFTNVSAVFFVYLSLYYLNKKANFNFIISIIFSIFAAFSNGAGIFVFPIGMFLLLLKHRWKDLLIWSSTAGLILYAYFYNYHTPEYKSIAITERLEQIDQVILCAFRFFGGSFKSVLHHHTPYITIVGLILTIFFIVVFFKKWEYFKTNPLMLSFLFFIVLSAGAASLSRGCGSATSDRMRLSHTLGLGLIYLCSVEAFGHLSKNKIKIVIVICLLFYFQRISYNIPEMIKHKERLEASYLAYISNDLKYIDSWPHSSLHPKMIKNILDVAKKRGFYSGYDRIIPKTQVPNFKDFQHISSKAKVKFNRFKDLEDGLFIHGNAFYNEDDQKGINHQLIHILLQSDKSSYIIPARKYKFYTPAIAKGLKRVAIKNTQSDFPDHSVFYFNVPKDKIGIPEGNYKLSVVVGNENNYLAIKHLKHIITFTNKK